MWVDRKKTTKMLAGVLGGAAITTAVVVCALSPQPQSSSVASGSGDSATGPMYTQPIAPAMKIETPVTTTPTVVVQQAASTLATPVASPTFKAAPPSGY